VLLHFEMTNMTTVFCLNLFSLNGKAASYTGLLSGCCSLRDVRTAVASAPQFVGSENFFTYCEKLYLFICSINSATEVIRPTPPTYVLNQKF
jgi:hypothetical protein